MLLTMKTVHNTTIKYMIRSIPFDGNINKSWGITKLASIVFKRQGYERVMSREQDQNTVKNWVLVLEVSYKGSFLSAEFINYIVKSFHKIIF